MAVLPPRYSMTQYLKKKQPNDNKASIVQYASISLGTWKVYAVRLMRLDNNIQVIVAITNIHSNNDEDCLWENFEDIVVILLPIHQVT